MTDRELMQQALDALEDACGGRCNAENNPCWQRDIANALRDRLAQPEQTLTCVCGAVWEGELMVHAPRDRLAQPEQGPVAWRTFDGDNGYNYIDYENNKDYCYWLEELHSKHKGWGEPLYTTPPAAQRPWVGLTDEELAELSDMELGSYDLCLEVEAKLNEKNT